MMQAQAPRPTPSRVSACMVPELHASQMERTLEAVRQLNAMLDDGDPAIRRITDRLVTIVVPEGTVIFEQARANLLATWRRGRHVRGRFLFPWRMVTDMPTSRDSGEHIRLGIRSLIASTLQMAETHLSPRSIALGNEISLLAPTRQAAAIAVAAHGLDASRVTLQHATGWSRAMLISPTQPSIAMGEAEDAMQSLLADANDGAGPQIAHSIIGATDTPGPKVEFDVAPIALQEGVARMDVVEAMRAIGRRA